MELCAAYATEGRFRAQSLSVMMTLSIVTGEFDCEDLTCVGPGSRSFQTRVPEGLSPFFLLRVPYRTRDLSGVRYLRPRTHTPNPGRPLPFP